ncbi:hypothetical protein H7097_01510, partial [Aeromicrobium sp.]|nr:hypothetical protein [Candidatus Saccharibacteria bacterium]
VGSITLRRSMPQIGLGTVKIEALRANAGDQTDHVRASIEIAILALSTVEQRVIVSDPYGETFERTAMWYRFAGAGVASILEPFTPRPALMMWQDGQGGEAIYDGQALAPPVSLPTARLHR